MPETFLCYYEKNQLILNFPYNAQLISKVKDIEKSYRRYNPENQCWSVSIQKYGHINKKVLKDLEKILIEWNFKIHSSASQYIKGLKENITRKI